MDELTALALAAQAGDQEALTALIRATQADVWRLCCHLAGRGAADDLTQEAFLRAYRALPRFRAESSVRTWLLAIARNTAIDALRTARRRPRTAPLLDRDGVMQPDASGAIATQDLLGRLDPDRRTALFLTQILGLPYADAAQVCRVPVGTIRSRVARGREDLAALLRAAEAREA